MKAHCSCCNTARTVGDEVAGKVACTALGAIVGKAAIAHPLGAIACGLLGLALGEFIDREVVPRCPVCGTGLRILAAAL